MHDAGAPEEVDVDELFDLPGLEREAAGPQRGVAHLVRNTRSQSGDETPKFLSGFA